MFKIRGMLKSAKKISLQINHNREIRQEWSHLQSNYSKLHTALSSLEAQEGDVIKFDHLMQALNLPQNLIQNYFDTVCFTCIDERAQHNQHNMLAVGIPGTFCLEKKQQSLFAKKIVIDCKLNQVKNIKLVPHARCGAAKEAVKKELEALGWDLDNIPEMLVDKKSVEYAQGMADTIITEAKKMDYDLDVKIEFMAAEQIEPKTFHNAIGSIINITSSDSLDLTRPHLDPKLFNENIDPMFNISGFGDDETIIDRIILSVNIAFGGKGMGTHIFCEQNPYLILLVADSQEAVIRAKDDILPMLKYRVEQKYSDKLVESFILDISDLA